MRINFFSLRFVLNWIGGEIIISWSIKNGQNTRIKKKLNPMKKIPKKG